MRESEKARDPSMHDGTTQLRLPAKRKLWIWRALIFILPVIVIIGAIGGTIAMGALKPTPDEKEETIKAIPVLTAKAEAGDVTLKVIAQGEVQPRTEINIVPQVSGKITYMSRKFIEGGKFNKGDLLIRVEPTEFELRVTQARANVAQAETVLTREKSEALIALNDWQEIGNGKAASPLTLREPQMAEAAAQLEAARAQLGEAELHLSRTSIFAPFSGRVTMRHVDQGEYVTAGTRLGEVYSTNVMDVRMPLTNEDLRRAGLFLGYEAKAGEGIPVKLSADVAGRYSEWKGQIVRTDSRFDSQTRVLFAYVEVRDPFGKGADEGTPLAPGIFVEAEIAGQKLDDVIIIPRAALRGKDNVYLANDDDTLSIQTVSVMSSDRDSAVLSGGIDVGASVITSPIRGVADGMKIAVVKSGALKTETDASGETP